MDEQKDTKSGSSKLDETVVLPFPKKKGRGDEDVPTTKGATNENVNKSFVFHIPKMGKTADKDAETTNENTSKLTLNLDKQDHIRSEGRPPGVKGTADNNEVTKKSVKNDVLSESLLKLLKVHEGKSRRDLLIVSLEDKLKDMEELYKKSMDEQQDMRHKFDSVMQELTTHKLIDTKLIEENRKLQKKPTSAQSTLNDQDKDRLELEAKKWKQRYEDLLKESLNRTRSEQNDRQMDDLMNKFKNLEKLMFQQNANFSTYVTGGGPNTSFPVIEISSASIIDISEEQEKPPSDNADEKKRELIVPGIGITEPTPTKSDYLVESEFLNQTLFNSSEHPSYSDTSTSEEEISRSNFIMPIIIKPPPPRQTLPVKPMSPAFLSVDSTFTWPKPKATPKPPSASAKSKQPTASSKPKQRSASSKPKQPGTSLRSKQPTGATQPTGTKLSTATRQSSTPPSAAPRAPPVSPAPPRHRARPAPLTLPAPLASPEPLAPPTPPSPPLVPVALPEKIPQAIEVEPENKLHKLEPTSTKAPDDTIESLKGIIDSQKKEIANLKQKLDKKYDQLQTTITQDQDHVNRDVKLLEQYEKSIDAVNDKYTAAMEELDDVVEGNKVLKRKIEDLENTLGNQEDRPPSITPETTRRMTDRPKRSHTLSEDVGNESTKKERGKEPLRDSTKRQEDAKLLASLQNENDDLERQIKEKDLHISNQKKRIEELKRKLLEPTDDDVISTKDALQNTCMCADEDTYPKYKQPKDQNMQDLADTNKKLQDQVALSAQEEERLLNELKSIVSRSDLEKVKLLAERAHIMKQLQSEKDEFKEVQERMLKDLDSVRMENEKLKQELRNINAKLRATNNDVDKQLLKYRGDNADLQDKLNMSNAELKCLKENSKQNANLKSENLKLKGKVTLLDRRGSDLERTKETIQELEVTNEYLKNRLKELEEEWKSRDRSTIRLDSTNEEIIDLTSPVPSANVTLISVNDSKEPVNDNKEPVNDNKEPVNDNKAPVNDNKEPVKFAAEVELLYDNSKYSNESEISPKDSKDSSYREQLRISFSPKQSMEKPVTVTIKKKSSRPTSIDTSTEPSNTTQRILCTTQMPPLCYRNPLANKPSLTNKQPKHPNTPSNDCPKCPHGHRTK